MGNIINTRELGNDGNEGKLKEEIIRRERMGKDNRKIVG